MKPDRTSSDISKVETPIKLPEFGQTLNQLRIILPTYNRASLLAEAIDSALSQTFADFELLIVDDGSTDHTADVISDAVRRDSRVRAIRSNNTGPAMARNLALDQPGSFDTIALLDSDDLWLPHHLEHAVAVLNEHPDVGFVFARHEPRDHLDHTSCDQMQAALTRTVGALRVNEAHIDDNRTASLGNATGSPLLLEPAQTKRWLLRAEVWPHTSTVVFRTDVSQTVPPRFDPALEPVEDLDFWLQLADLDVGFAYLDEVHCHVRYFGDNLTNLTNLGEPQTLRFMRAIHALNQKKFARCESAEDRRRLRARLDESASLVAQCESRQRVTGGVV